MASKKLSDCTELTTIASGDWVPVGDSDASNELKKVSPVNLLRVPALADGAYHGVSISATAGENLTIGQVCYLKSDGKLWKADADASTTMPVVAMATASISADAAGVFLLNGFIRDDDNWGGALTVGGMVYASCTEGGVVQTPPSGSGDQVQIIGVAYAARTVWFIPQLAITAVP